MEKHNGSHKINRYAQRRHLSGLDSSAYIIFQRMAWCSCEADYQISYTAGPKRFLLLYVTEGECSFYLNNTSHILREGSVVLTDTSAGYSALSTRGPHKAIWLYFSGSLAEHLVTDITRTSGNFYDNTSIFHYLNEICQMASTDSYDENTDFMISCMIYQLLAHIAVSSTKQNRTLPAVQYIEKHYRENISADDLARLCDMSKYHFIRSFHAEHNVTPVVYINKFRISVSLKLLSETNDSVSEIAEQSGFQTASYFSKTFRQYTGHSPREYRNLSLYTPDVSQAII